MGLHSVFWGAGEMAGMLSKGGVRKQNVTSCKKNVWKRKQTPISAHIL